MITSLSLFSGCLGLDLGLEMSGIKTVAYVEKDKNCQQTISQNRPNTTIFDDVFNKDIFRIKNVDIIVGGPPCQSFSTIGKRRFLDDERGLAMLGFVKVIDVIRPRMFLMENVQGIVSADEGRVLKQLIDRFSKMGYTIDWSIIDASDFQVPQIRKRFVMIGTKGIKIELSKMPIFTQKVLLKDVIKDLENEGEYCQFSPSMVEVMKKIPEGGNWKSLNPKEQDKVMGKANRKSGGLTAFYRRLSYEKPSPTLLTSPTQKATTLAHPKKNRPLSIQEYKRIQGFSDSWSVAGSIREQYRQLGNAVPVLMGKALGKLIKKAV